jgi:putative membrane protein insertion efficiency factor
MASAVLRGLIWLYQLLLSPLLGPRCRYWPSCSEYAAQAVHEHGPARGLGLAAQRLLRCHPWGGSGVDPVPPATGARP